MFDWINRQLGDRAPMVGVLAVFAFVLSAGLTYNFVRDFGVNDNSARSSKVGQNHR